MIVKYRIASAVIYILVIGTFVVEGKVFHLADYPNTKTCNGDMVGSDHFYASATANYKRIKEIYSNCTHIIGNLIVTDLRNQDDKGNLLDYSFFNSIVEVYGVVRIRGNSMKRLQFKNLRVIRGLTTYVKEKSNKAHALYIGLNNHHEGDKRFSNYLHEVDMSSLVSIVHGNLAVESNPGLCYMPHTINWSYILENPATQNVSFQTKEYNKNFCKGGVSCHKDCPLVDGKRYCWGPGADQCQKIMQCDQRNCPKPRRCFVTKSGRQQCCHEQCTGGCTGMTNKDCVACKRFLNGNECVPRCPVKTIYDQYRMKKVPNPEHRLAFSSFCVKTCPQYSIVKDDVCEANCDLRNHYLKDGRLCLPCTGDICKKHCFVDDIIKQIKDENLQKLVEVTLTKSVLKRLKGCTRVQGDLKITPGVITAKTYNLQHELPTYEDFMNLKDVKVWIGRMYLDMPEMDIKNMSFLSNLETIRSFPSDGVQISRSDLEFLGLTSLKYVVLEKFLIFFNKKLCYLENFSDNRFKFSYISKIVVNQKTGHNKKFRDCKLLNQTCDRSCDQQFGCWGPGPALCVRCRHLKVAGRCVDRCSDVLGFFLDPVSQKCLRCHKECKQSCTGPNADHCTAGCIHAELNGTCVSACPEYMYLDKKTTKCRPCSRNCSKTDSGPWCVGPRDEFGPNGCRLCEKVEILKGQKWTRCVQACQAEGFYEGMLDKSFLPPGFKGGRPSACKPCHSDCLTCSDATRNCPKCRRARYNDMCFAKCPSVDSFDRGNGTCVTCDPSCRKGCFGSGPFSCNACKVRKVYTKPDKSQWQCNSSCPSSRHITEVEEETQDTVCVDSPTALSRQTKMVIIYSSVGVPGLLLVVVLIIVCVCVQRRRALVKERELLEMKFLRQLEDQQVPLNETDQQPNFSQLRIIGANQLSKGYEIGSGAFGTVFLGTWRPTKERPTDAQLEIKVAIKTLKDSGGDGFSNTATNEFLSEAHVMASVDHPACIRLLGVCLSSQMQLISEFMPLGSLADFLPKHRQELGSQQLLNWAVQISQGMAYLEAHGIVHRDLAARNVLLQSMQQIRITDFGLAKLMDDEENGEFQAEGGRFPVKWLAIECLRRRLFSHKSDVWAFGVTLWELCSLGQRPYADVRATELIDFLERGERLQQPEICTLDMYMLMIKCWLLEPDSRPTFEELVTDLRKKAADPARYLVIPNDSGRLTTTLRSNSAVSGSGPRHVSPVPPARSRSVTPDVSRVGAVSVSSDEAARKPVTRGASSSAGFHHLTDAVNRRKAESPMRRHANDDTRYAADPMTREDNDVFADYLTPTDEDPRAQDSEDYLEADTRPHNDYYNETGPRQSDSSVAYVNSDVLDGDDYLSPQGFFPSAHNPDYGDPAQTALLSETNGEEENGYLLPIELGKGPGRVEAISNPDYVSPKRDAYIPILAPRSNRSTPNKDLV